LALAIGAASFDGEGSVEHCAELIEAAHRREELGLSLGLGHRGSHGWRCRFGCILASVFG
jgi:hypothetical protein